MKFSKTKRSLSLSLIPLIITVILIAIFALALRSDKHKSELGQFDHQSFRSIYNNQPTPNVEIFIAHLTVSWCENCKQNEEYIQIIKNKFNLPIYAILLNENPDKIAELSQIRPKLYDDILATNDPQAYLKLGASGTPETFIIGKDGFILYSHKGVLNSEIISNVISKKLRTEHVTQ